MSAYKGHRGPNVSQYIANLNEVSPPQESINEPLPTDDDFSAFLNADFFDVNSAPIVSFDSPIALDVDVDLPAEPSSQPDLGSSSRKHNLHASGDPNMEFNLNGK
jgi:hypothetical protein